MADVSGHRRLCGPFARRGPGAGTRATSGRVSAWSATDAAFELLRRYCRGHHYRLSEVAVAVLADPSSNGTDGAPQVSAPPAPDTAQVPEVTTGPRLHTSWA